jgi:hypothetical protein
MLHLVKRPTLAMLVGALWLTAGDPAFAGSPGTDREQFASLLANRKNLELVHRLKHQLAHITQLSNQLQQQQGALTNKVTGQSFNPILVQLEKLDAQFLVQSQRITQRLQNLNNIANTTGVNPRAVDRLRSELTRLDAAIGTNLATIQRAERSAATPFAPGGF